MSDIPEVTTVCNIPEEMKYNTIYPEVPEEKPEIITTPTADTIAEIKKAVDELVEADTTEEPKEEQETPSIRKIRK